MFTPQDYADYEEIKQPDRILSINSAPASSVSWPNPTTESPLQPLQEPVTEAMRPQPTTTESKNIEVNALAPILTVKCR